MTKHINCLICSSQNLKNLKGYEKAHLTKCKKCSFVFAQKIPTKQELVAHYENYSRNDYLSPITIKRYNELLDKFEAFRKTNKILDVGCGIGYFLEEAKNRGWEVYGTEFTNDAVEICKSKGIKISEGILDINNYSEGSFDIITSFEVIEHINNPVEEIKKFKYLLRDKGMVYLTTPNFNSLLRYKLKEKYNVISYPEHLSYFTKKTIRKLFSKEGFSTKIKTTGFSLTRLKTSQNKSDQKFISKTSDDEKIRNSIESKWFLRIMKKIINYFLSVAGVGDTLKCYFVK